MNTNYVRWGTPHLLKPLGEALVQDAVFPQFRTDSSSVLVQFFILGDIHPNQPYRARTVPRHLRSRTALYREFGNLKLSAFYIIPRSVYLYTDEVDIRAEYRVMSPTEMLAL